MNDIKFDVFKDFPEKWKLVTIRFRKDTGEMRLVYANDLAWKSLSKGEINYPDGAVFGKTGIHTGVDPQFVSSVIPKGIRRYQLMVKNRKKYAATGGWGYGLFDSDGKTYPEDPKAIQDSCYACHTMVENRGDVFSEPFSFETKINYFKKQNSVESKIQFNTVGTSSLPKEIQKILTSKFTQVRQIKNEILMKNVFQGMLDELKPVLEGEARKSALPSLFLSHDRKKFVIVAPRNTDECMGHKGYEVVSTGLDLTPVSEKYCSHD